MLQQRLQRVFQTKPAPILFLLTINLIVGLFTFQDYGLSLDEPLFYSYGDAIGYAYSPIEWFSGEFDLRNAYGSSPGDHANRGPGYLLLARIPARLLQNLGLDMASSWHLVNFITFQIGLYFFYILCLRWMKPLAALCATAFLSTQPIIWEHAFINPKDPPFLVFFLITLELSFRMAERLANLLPGETKFQTFKYILLPAFLLGLTTNIRVLGPLTAVLAGVYFLTFRKPARIWWFIPYGLIAYGFMVITWPFLWEAPIGKFIRVVQFMSENPTTLKVYFYGGIYPANKLPLRYLPTMMFITLTEPVWIMAGWGFCVAVFNVIRKKSIQWHSLLPTFLWFGIPFIYVLLRQPPMYDGFRHFLFITPPLFVLGGIALDLIFQRIRHGWLRPVLILALLLPGILPSLYLHPYQYTYYNQFVGGTESAAKRFETDYWLTCYKDAVEQLLLTIEGPATLYVHREFYIADYFAPEHLTVLDYHRKLPQTGDYVLNHSRANPGLQLYPNNPPYFLRIERGGAIFCEIRKR